MKKEDFVKGIGAILLLLFSFYYTDKVIDIVRNSDPIMREIKENDTKYTKKAVNAKIKENTIIPGVSGKVVDYDKSYQKMKEYGSYNESLTVFKEEAPTVSIDDYYDKFIQSGNDLYNRVALIFPVSTDSDITEIVKTLNDKSVTATFFLDGLYVENNMDFVSTLTNFELEVLSYDNKYEQIYFTNSLNTLKSITNTPKKYCYASYDSKEVLELCSNLSLHTVLPTIKVGNYPFSEIKKKLGNGAIISMPINASTKIELPVVIDYIKQKGYELVSLDLLLSESSEK